MAENKTQPDTQVLVIGGGPGGYAAAFRAADLGLDVTLVSDEERLGGVCLLRGCIPSKALLQAASTILEARAADRMGISFNEPEIDVDRLREWKDDVVKKLTDGLAQLAETRGVRLVYGRASFLSSDAVRIEGNEAVDEISFEHAIVATGSSPVPVPGTEFGGRIMSSAEALDLEDIPGKLLVVGGGYVGLEMGTVYATLGSEVTVVEMMDRLMPLADDDLVAPLADHLEELFNAIHLNTKVSDIEENDDGVAVSFEGETELSDETFDRVLIAVGRRPNTGELGLEEAGVETDDDGFITVDEERRTNVDSIFAIGDAAGGQLLAHEAMHEGRVAAEVIAGEPSAFDARAVPAVVYTEPQIAWCGLTEKEAEDEEIEIEVARFPWRASGRAMTMAGEAGFTKLILEPESGRILGAGIVGPEAESLIAEAVLAIEMGALARDLAESIHPHPTLSETLGEAAEVFLGSPVHLAPSSA